MFGAVESPDDMKVVKKIEGVKVDKSDRPLKDVKIVSVDVEEE